MTNNLKQENDQARNKIREGEVCMQNDQKEQAKPLEVYKRTVDN